MRPEVVFDHKGRRLPADPAALARILRCPPVPEAISYAIRRHGFILVRPVRNSLVLELEPSAVSILAAWATFFEVMERAPKRVVLAYPGNGGHRRYEIVSSDFAALRRIEELALAAGGLDLGHPRAGLSQSEGIPLAAHCVRAPSSKSGRVVSFRGRDGLAVRVRGDDRSQRSCRQVDAMSPLDIGWVAYWASGGPRAWARAYPPARHLLPLIWLGSYAAALTWWTPARRIIRWDIGFARGGPSTPINPAMTV